MLKDIENYQKVAEPHLHQICDVCHATSVWLAQHDFKKRVATVVAEYISEQANSIEKMGDIGDQYPEGIKSKIWTWLRMDHPQPFQFHVEDIPADELERIEYMEDDVKSVLCFVVRNKATVWGFVEVWETSKKRVFTPEEIERGQEIVEQLETVIDV